MTYQNAKLVILTGSYNRESMSNMLDMFLMRNRITLEQYTELMDLMDSKEVA